MIKLRRWPVEWATLRAADVRVAPSQERPLPERVRWRHCWRGELMSVL